LLCGIIGALGVYGIGLFSHFTQAQTYAALVSNFLGGYVDFLLLTYLWVPAWAAVLLVDFFIVRRGRYASEELTRGKQGCYWYRGGVFWRAFIAWVVGVVITIPFIGSATLPWLSQPWQGPLAHLLGGMDISGIVGAVVSAFLYYILARPYFGPLVHKQHIQ
jgi:NCS1 family nucleobase:cation symporter-1